MVDMLSIELFLTDKKNFELHCQNQMGTAINQNLQKRIGLATSCKLYRKDPSTT